MRGYEGIQRGAIRVARCWTQRGGKISAILQICLLLSNQPGERERMEKYWAKQEEERARREEWWKRGRKGRGFGIEKEFGENKVGCGGWGDRGRKIGYRGSTREGAGRCGFARAASLRVESTARKEVGWRAGVSYRSNYLLNRPDLFL